jgi:tellurite resistance protein TehA-like permease
MSTGTLVAAVACVVLSGKMKPVAVALIDPAETMVPSLAIPVVPLIVVGISQTP